MADKLDEVTCVWSTKVRKNILEMSIERGKRKKKLNCRKERKLIKKGTKRGWV